MVAVLGCTCSNCNSDIDIEYHHIVPIALGGTNKFTNIAPLCSKCHRAAHRGRHVSSFQDRSRLGRPRSTCSEELIEKYLKCEIGASEFKSKTGMSNKSHISDFVSFREYLSSHGIQKYRNNIDVIRSNGIMRPGKVIGYIEYNNGTRLEFRAVDQTLDWRRHEK